MHGVSMKTEKKMSFLEEVTHNLNMALEKANTMEVGAAVDCANDPTLAEFEIMLKKHTIVNCTHWRPKR